MNDINAKSSTQINRTRIKNKSTFLNFHCFTFFADVVEHGWLGSLYSKRNRRSKELDTGNGRRVFSGGAVCNCNRIRVYSDNGLRHTKAQLGVNLASAYVLQQLVWGVVWPRFFELDVFPLTGLHFCSSWLCKIKCKRCEFLQLGNFK